MTDGGNPEPLLPELGHVTTRSRAMITCYPGNGSRYSTHVDNAIGNGRKLTCILYLNKGWRAADGGELRIYPPDGQDMASGTLIAPQLNRLLLFWSDRRCPHEVCIPLGTCNLVTRL